MASSTSPTAPPWDTWMFCVQQTAGSDPAGEPMDLLIGWVPSSLVATVERGIRVNPYDCIYWASEADLAEWGLGLDRIAPSE